MHHGISINISKTILIFVSKFTQLSETAHNQILRTLNHYFLIKIRRKKYNIGKEHSCELSIKKSTMKKKIILSKLKLLF
jgi:hypothetical protein